MKKIYGFALILIFAVIAVATAIQGLQPAKPLSKDAPENKFSSGRAFEKLKIITAQPHPTGFVANRIVKDYLVYELERLGLKPVVQPANVEKNGNSYYIENIIAIKRGTAGKDADKILLSAHYDARGEAPGAGDNGYAVASVLEVLRALKYYPPLKNDLVIVFPDGEELGSLGARAFIRDEKISDSIGLVLNFDGRGSSGPSLMFETGKGNYEVVREFNKAKGSSFSNSLSVSIYQMIPNYTDFTWYLKKAHQGLNFAHLGSVETYHAPTDDIAHLDAGTVQSHGNSMLAAVLHFGNISLKNDDKRDAVYFHLIFPGLIIYPADFALPFAIAALLLFAFILYSGIRKGKMNFLRILESAGIFILRIIAAGVAVYFCWQMIGPMNAGFGKFEGEWVPNSDYILAGFLAASLIIFLLFQKKTTNRNGVLNTAAGVFLVWLIAAIATSVYFRGGSYLFLWPLIFGLIPVTIIVFRRNIPLKRKIITAMFFALPGIFLLTQVIILFYETMTLKMAGAIAAMFVLTCGLVQTALSVALSEDTAGSSAS